MPCQTTTAKCANLAVDGWGFKQYVLGMLFYRYISENLASYVNRGERDAGDKSFDYASLFDAEAESAIAEEREI